MKDFEHYLGIANHDIQMANNHNALKSYVASLLCNYDDLVEENEELKKHLEMPETCNLKTLEDYKSYYEDTTREQILEDTYIDYCAYVNLAHRYSELKKQLEELKKPQMFIDTQDIEERYGEELYQDYLKQQNEELKRYKMLGFKHLSDQNEKFRNQQKEFVKYLEDYIDLFDDMDIEEQASCDTIEEILSKYKEIIGGNNEK